MGDQEILDLANAVSAAIREVATAQAEVQATMEVQARKYAESDAIRSRLDEANRVLANARAALDAGLASR